MIHTTQGTPTSPEGSARIWAAHDGLQILRRRWRTAAIVLVLVASAAYSYSSIQTPRYAASADVLLSRQNLAASLNNITDPGAFASDFNRVAQTQANLATAPAVVQLTLKTVGLPESNINGLLSRSSVRAIPNADILTFEVIDSDPVTAKRLAAAYARSYTVYRRTLDSSGIERALTKVRERIADLRRQSGANEDLIASLRANEDRLSTLEAFQASNAFVVRVPQAASQISPRPLRALLIGLLLGGLLGVGLAWLRDRLDTRVQEPDEVAHELGMPLLASVPTLPRRMRDTHDLVMLSEPHGPLSEAFRIMRTNFDFATIDGHIKTVMVTSSVSGEGKSTTAANLALAFARSGRRVILVDLDLRRPYIARFFNLTGLPGLTDVALGNASLDDALTPIDVDTGAVLTELSATARNGKPRDAISAAMGGANNADGAGTNLRVLASGPMPPDTGEFLSSSWLNEVLSDLTRRADIVLVDATPLLGVSDALTLMAHVDAVLFIARLQVIRRSMFRDLRRLLASSPARVVGCVAVGVASGPGYGYGYGYGYLATNDRVAPSADADSRVGLPPVGSKPR